MARTATLLQLRTRLDQRADIENDQHFTTAEKNSLINEELAALWDELVAASPPDYHLSDATFITTTNTITYSLATIAADFYKLRRAQVDEQNGHRRSLIPMDPDERVVLQAPSGGDTVRVEYIPACPLLVADVDTFDGVNGWEELTVIGAAIRCYFKKQQDPSALMAEREFLRQRVKAMGDRDWGTAGRIQRQTLRRTCWPYMTNNLTHYRLRGTSLEVYRLDPVWQAPP